MTNANAILAQALEQHEESMRRAEEIQRKEEVKKRADKIDRLLRWLHCLGLEVTEGDLEDSEKHDVLYKFPDVPVALWPGHTVLIGGAYYPPEMFDEELRFLGVPQVGWREIWDLKDLGRLVSEVQQCGDALYDLRPAPAPAPAEVKEALLVCPLLDLECLREKCAWYTDGCTVALAAQALDAQALL